MTSLTLILIIVVAAFAFDMMTGSIAAFLTSARERVAASIRAIGALIGCIRACVKMTLNP